MALTTQTIAAKKAYHIGLIDELDDNLDDNLRRIVLRLNRIQEETVGDLKAYFRKMWIITDAMEETAVAEISRLIAKPKVRATIENFIEHQQFPWEVTTKQRML